MAVKNINDLTVVAAVSIQEIPVSADSKITIGGVVDLTKTELETEFAPIAETYTKTEVDNIVDTAYTAADESIDITDGAVKLNIDPTGGNVTFEVTAEGLSASVTAGTGNVEVDEFVKETATIDTSRANLEEMMVGTFKSQSDQQTHYAPISFDAPSTGICLIEWGDGEETIVPVGTTGGAGMNNISHKYATNGNYDFSIKFAPTTNVTLGCAWDTSGYSSGSFVGLKKLIVPAHQTSLSKFFNSTNIESITGTEYNTSAVTNMSEFLSSRNYLKDISGLEYFDTSNVTDMSKMFEYSSMITDFSPLSTWDVSSVGTFESMFSYTKIATSAILKDWVMSSATTLRNMFSYASSLTSLVDVTSWDISKVVTFDGMFSNCRALTSIAGMQGWSIPAATSLSGMFQNCSSLTDFSPISSWNISKVENFSYLFSGSGLTDPSQITAWGDVIAATNIEYMFSGCAGITSLNAFSFWFYGDGVTSLKGLFAGTNITNADDLMRWGTSNITDYTSMFEGCSQLTSMGYAGRFNFGNATDTSRMFSGTAISNIDEMSTANMSKVTNMYGMFSRCSNLLNTDGARNWVVTALTNMGDLFGQCIGLTSIDLSGWDTAGITETYGAFTMCNAVTEAYGKTQADCDKLNASGNKPSTFTFAVK